MIYVNQNGGVADLEVALISMWRNYLLKRSKRPDVPKLRQKNAPQATCLRLAVVGAIFFLTGFGFSISRHQFLRWVLLAVA
ncbi:MAG: hypothetical protein ACLP1D_13190 [Xanthobacteraceae bacterium]